MEKQEEVLTYSSCSSYSEYDTPDEEVLELKVAVFDKGLSSIFLLLPFPSLTCL
jgi:hypothetical protein